VQYFKKKHKVGGKCMAVHLTAPLSTEDVKSLHAGDSVLLSGVVYTARDAAHERMAKAVERGESLPVSLNGQTLYYAGPTPTPPGQAVGAIGPTTSTRMDAYTPLLLSLGLRAMIGKGSRSPEVIAAMQRYPSVYFAAIGGAAALMARCVTSCEVVAYEDLGTESIKKLTLKDLPLIVAVDCYGVDYYELGQQSYLNEKNI
jgi:fumarate hydratase subunit beta